MTEKRFTTIYDEQSKMMQYVDTQKEESNWWAIWNANKTLQIMNELADKNEQLKQKNDKLNHLVDKKFDEYEYIVELEEENQILKNEIVAIVGLCIKMEDYINDIKIIANNRGGKND